MRIFQGAGSGTGRPGGLRRAIGTPTVVAGLIGAVGLAVWLGVLAGPVSAGTPTVCTWTGAGANSNWSTGGNWSGSGCITSGPPAGAQAVFPAVTNETIVFDSGVSAAAAALDSLVFQAGGYSISPGSGAQTMTLTPTATPAVGISMDAPLSTGPDILSNPIDLGKSQSFSATYSNGWYLVLSGVIAGTGDALTVTSVAGSDGTVSLRAANTYSGGTTATTGVSLDVTNNSGLGPNSSPVIVENGATLRLEGGASLANPVAVGSGSGGGTLDAYIGTDTLTGAITLTGNTTLSTELAGGALVLSGPIGDGSNGYGLTVADYSSSAPQGVTLSGANTYSGGTTVSSGTLLDEPASTGTNPLGASAGAVTVDHNATLELHNSDMSVPNPLTVGDGTAGTALVLAQSGFDYWTGAVTLESGTTDELADSGNREALWVTGVIGGPGTLTSGDALNTTGFVVLEPGGAGSCVPNTYSGGTVVVDLLEAFCAAALGPSSTPVTIDSSGKFFWTLSSSGSVSYNVTDNGWYYIYPGTGTTTTLTGNVSGSGAILASGDNGSSATTVLAGTDDPAGGTVVAPNGSQGTTLDVTGATGAVTVREYCTLQGSGTVGAITSTGTVQPGPSPGNLTTSAGATLGSGGVGSLS
ncbi:MAG: beta strand repeat-containing protein, partial [Candidatus Dormibacteria bacterium]